MSLWLNDEPDLLALAGGRELKICPWHFTRISIDSNITAKDARDWIWKNLEGRFCLIQNFNTDKWTPMNEVGFEEPYEASAFVLSQPLMNRDHDSFW